jgi:hypothetical protein
MFRLPCPVCSSGDILTFIEINDVPVYCNWLSQTHSQALGVPRGDIELSFCERCGHVFNSKFDPQLLHYTHDYENSLHFSPHFQQYAFQLALKLVERYALYQKDIIEIGSGQGDFLAILCEQGNNRGVGFDPSYQPGTGQATQRPISFVQDLYSEEYAGHPADFICSRHVLEHIHKPGDFIAMLRRVIGDRHQIVVFFEVPNVLFTLSDLGIWDLIYEHPSYFSPASLETVFVRHGFTVLCLEKTFNGQFLTIESMPRRLDEPPGVYLEPDQAAMNREVNHFADQYYSKVQSWRENLEEIKASQRKAVIWGAGSKGVTFLNTFPTQDIIPYVVDINPRKKGRFVAGSGQEIITPEFLKSYVPDVVIIMNSNYQNEIQKTVMELGLHPEFITA